MKGNSIRAGRATMLAVLLIAAAALGLAIWFHEFRSTPSGDPGDFEPLSSAEETPTALPPLPAREATYVGSQACVECHQDQLDSYLHTPHSKALANVDPDAEPPDGEFRHEPSHRAYRVYRQDGQLRHQECAILADGSELLLADHPMRYVMGSGNHSRSYLVEIEGFYNESPITWYTSRQAWDLSPGYAKYLDPPGFARPTVLKCVQCHSGRVQSVENSLHRLRVDEEAIGCESCHGPGSRHVQVRRENPQLSGSDETIVNPRNLNRLERESICSQCHLASVGPADVRGRQGADFRPGELLTTVRVDHHLETPGEQMTVVGHVEQMRLSRCYQESDMDCSSCHDPHNRPADPAARITYFRDKCLACHGEEACRLEKSARLQQDANDACATCHMPKGPTDIPHFAFTHHRVGIHVAPPHEPSGVVELGNLVPIGDVSQLPKLERDRCLGVAYVQVAGQAARPKFTEIYSERALKLLESVRNEGVRDAESESLLAFLYRSRRQFDLAIETARSALKMEPMRPDVREDALEVLAKTLYEQHRFSEALPALRELTRVRLHPEDHFRIGQCLAREGDFRGALKAGTVAARVAPGASGVVAFLGKMHEKLGHDELAQKYLDRAEKLRAISPPPPE